MRTVAPASAGGFMSADTVTPPPITPPASAAAPSAPAPVPASRLRRWLKRLLPLVALLGLCVTFAPAVVAKTGLRNRIAREALADLRGSVEVGGASLGWFSPIELRDVTIRDEAGRTVASAPRITSQKSLLDLARNKAEPGEFTLESPTISIVCEKNTTNLETAIAEYLKDDKPAAPTRIPVAIRVTGGTLTLTDAETGKTASIEGIGASVNIPASREEAITLKLTAATGGLNAGVSIGDTSAAKVVSVALPLETFTPLLKRADPGLSVSGDFTSDLSVTWGRAGVAVAGTAGAKQLAVAGLWQPAPGSSADTLRFESVALPLDVELAGRVIRVRKFDLTCDVGTISARGNFDPDEPLEKLLTQPGVSVSANVELAKLAGKLPKLLRVKDGTELREGKLEAKLDSRADEKGVVWEGTVRTSALKGMRDGKPIEWEQPLDVEFIARYRGGEIPTFDKFICTSDFIAVNAKTTPETVQAAANVYLHQLNARLAEFIDLKDITLDGEATASLVGRREADGSFRAGGSLELKNFAFAYREKGLKEPALKLEVGATGKAPSWEQVELQTATATVTANGDELKVTLLEPIADVRKLSSGSADVRLAGDVARWKSRVGSFVKIPPYAMSGTIDANGKAMFSTESIAIDRLNVTLTKVQFRGAGLNVDEPNMNAVGDFTLTRATNTATIAKLTLTSAPLSVTNGTFTFELPKAGSVTVSGNGQCVCDLNRLGATVKLFADARGPDALYGRGAGPLRFRYAGDVTTFGGTLDVTDFAYGPKEKLIWAEPTLRLEADGDYRDSTDAVTLSVAKVDRPGFGLDAKGSLSKLTSTQDVSLTGTLKYDWAKLTPLVREFVGASFNATGSGTRAVSVNGQLNPPGAVPRAGMFVAMNADAALGWDSIKAYGFDVGAGELKGKMTRGVVTVSPITATFCEGKVTLAPTVKLDTTPGEMTLAKGAVIERAKLTPAATAGALGYALPAIANAGQAEGEISASIGDNRLILGDFTKSNAQGTLVIHKATIGAGPVASEVAKLLGAKNTTMTLANESTVPVQVANGRVHHQNFTFKISGTTLHTSGSVGFDQTLDLVVDVPLPKDLPALKNNPLLIKAVAGKVVKVPVKGTLSKPMIDPKAFEQAVIALAREGAKDVGKDLLDKELNKLFPGMTLPGTPGGTIPKLPFPFPFGKKP
jgi:hypothetical protein